jgi:hypothetical protein
LIFGGRVNSAGYSANIFNLGHSAIGTKRTSAFPRFGMPS